jgi:large subunit ribosomal protein L6
VNQELLAGIPVEINDSQVLVTRNAETRDLRAKHGLVRALLANAVHGVSQGFSKKLEIHGVCYRAELKGKDLHLALGFSHPVVYKGREGVDMNVDAKENTVEISGANRQQVGQVAAEIRSLKKPEPYKGKGIRYSDELIRRKVGKAGAK